MDEVDRPARCCFPWKRSSPASRKGIDWGDTGIAAHWRGLRVDRP
jgi:hypothetical protein